MVESIYLFAGAVGAIRNVAHPVYVARLVMERTPHVLLVGEGAKRFANDNGVPDVPIGKLVTKRAVDALEEFKKTGRPNKTELG